MSVEIYLLIQTKGILLIFLMLSKHVCLCRLKLSSHIEIRYLCHFKGYFHVLDTLPKCFKEMLRWNSAKMVGDSSLNVRNDVQLHALLSLVRIWKLSQGETCFHDSTKCISSLIFWRHPNFVFDNVRFWAFTPLSIHPTKWWKWSNTLKQYVGNSQWWSMMMNCFWIIFDWEQALSLISSRDNCQRYSSLHISNTTLTGFELTQNLSSDFQFIVDCL